MKKIVKRIWFLFVRYYVFFVWKIFPPVIKESTQQHILILRLDAIGDTILFSGCLQHIRKKYPEAHIAIVVRDYVQALLQYCTFIDEIIPWSEKTFRWNPLYRLSFMRRIATQRCDVLLYPLWTQTQDGNDMCQLLHSKQLYVFSGENSLHSQCFKNATVAEVPQNVVLEYERYKYLLHAMNIEVENEEIFPAVFSSPDVRRKIDVLFAHNIQQTFVVIAPGAGTQNRIWATHKWVEVINRVIEETRYDVFLLGGKNDTALCEKIFLLSNNARITNVAAQFSLPEVSEIIRRAAIYIGSETGMVHIAAATGTPTVCIIGGGHFGRFFPYGNTEKNKIVYKQMDCYNCNWICKYETTRCIEEISTDAVWNEVERMLIATESQLTI
jgi:ADP-heptose:LPS heptosyltransferase